VEGAYPAAKEGPPRVSLSFAIQHHPSRADLLPRLLEAVPEAFVCSDPEPETKLNWPVGRLAWGSFSKDATHHVVLEDDAIPCAHFREAVELAIAARPTYCLSFWANKKEVGEALVNRFAWVRSPKFYGTVCVALPTPWILAFIEWGDGEQYEGRPSVDWRLREFLASISQRPLLSAPCLVQHGEPAGSLLWANGGGRNRVTKFFADDLGIDARTVRWNSGYGSS
jgi:FAD/FMN-containing dehydrogenase